jgi:hypothetical protein
MLEWVGGDFDPEAFEPAGLAQVVGLDSLSR